MILISDRGYAGASLRELARRVQMSQPSLYHYFDSKDEMVEQIVRAYAVETLAMPDVAPVIESLEQGLRYGLTRIIETFESGAHVIFMRFLMAISREKPELRSLGRNLMHDRAVSVMKAFVDGYVDEGELRPEDSRDLIELVTNAMVMRMVKRHLLFGDGADDPDPDVFADFVVDTALRGVKARKQRADEKADEL